MTVPRNPHPRTPQHERLDRLVRLLSRSMAAVFLVLVSAMWLSTMERRGIEEAADLPILGGADAPQPASEGRAALRGVAGGAAAAVGDREKERLEGAAPPHRDGDSAASSPSAAVTPPGPPSTGTDGGGAVVGDAPPAASGPLPPIAAAARNITGASRDRPRPLRSNTTFTVLPRRNETRAHTVVKEWVGRVKNATRPDADATGEVTGRMKTTKNTMLVP